jgi:hypothetical protein
LTVDNLPAEQMYNQFDTRFHVDPYSASSVSSLAFRCQGQSATRHVFSLHPNLEL